MDTETSSIVQCELLKTDKSNSNIHTMEGPYEFDELRKLILNIQTNGTGSLNFVKALMTICDKIKELEESHYRHLLDD